MLLLTQAVPQAYKKQCGLSSPFLTGLPNVLVCKHFPRESNCGHLSCLRVHETLLTPSVLSLNSLFGSTVVAFI